MEKVLRQLYYGRLSPWEQNRPQSREFRTAYQREQQIRAQFEENLDAAQRQTLEEYLDAASETGDFLRYDAFCAGFRLGAKFMQEIYEP